MNPRAALLALSLTGCMLGPDYQRPELDLPSSFRGQPGPAAPASLADLPWWGVFEDEVLQRLVNGARAKPRHQSRSGAH